MFNFFKKSSPVCNNKILINKLNSIIDNIPPNLSELELIRYIYLSLGKILVTDTNYGYQFDYYKRHRIFENAKENSIPKTNEVICNSASELLVYLLKKFNIDAKTYYNTGIDHGETIVHTSDNKFLSLNLYGDLSKIQTNRKTAFFAPENSTQNGFSYKFAKANNISFSFISDDEIKKIDDKLGYTFNGLYTNDFMDMLKNEFSNNIHHILPPNIDFKNEYEKNEFLLKYIVDFLIEHCNILNEEQLPVGCEEMSHYYWTLFSSVLPPDFKKRINLYNCFFDKKISNNEIVTILSLSYKNSYVYYIYNNTIGKFIEVPEQKISKLIKNGLKTNCNTNIAGFEEQENIAK